MVPYWEQLFVTQTITPRALTEPLSRTCNRFGNLSPWKRSPLLNTAPGPDSITPRQWRTVPDDVKLRIFSIMILCGGAPGRLLRARATLIRHLNSILARRVSTTIQIDARQCAFRPVDGCAINISLLDLLLRFQRENFSTAHIVILDVAKAFDMVSRQAIYDTLQSYEFPGPFIRYLEYTYLHLSTRLTCDGWTSDEITPARGQ